MANESGTPIVEIIQSSANTRPRSRSGTSRWTSVTQTTTRYVIAPSVMNATIIACQTDVTIPNPAVPNIPSAHARYIAVTGLRGRVPRWPNTAAAITAPTPPAPKTNPSDDAFPPRSFFTTTGTNVSHGPQTASRLTVAPNIAISSHRCCRTYRNPSATSPKNEVCSLSSFRVRRVRIARIIAAENAKVAASARKANPTPNQVMRTPPTSGPINVIAKGLTSWARELACTRRSAGTIAGVIDENAGWKTACPAP
jgi:hypothetical protein